MLSAKDALVYCIMSEKFVLDKNGKAHWIEWGWGTPKLCSDAKRPFDMIYAPYTKTS